MGMIARPRIVWMILAACLTLGVAWSTRAGTDGEHPHRTTVLEVFGDFS